MKKNILTTAAALMFVGAVAVQAQDTTRATSSRRIRVGKDMPASTSTTSGGEVATPSTAMNMAPVDSANNWYLPATGTCSSVDVNAARAVTIKSDMYNSGTMISPDSAKVIALCAVPGQIGSGEMNMTDGRTEYAIDIIPNKKKTHTKVIVDAQTGAVLSSKQFGGLRGLTGWVRESAEHKSNTTKAPNDSTGMKPPF
jgi:hypothetical protein